MCARFRTLNSIRGMSNTGEGKVEMVPFIAL